MIEYILLGILFGAAACCAGLFLGWSVWGKNK